ncbi:hypothetical protein GJ744_003345 [Endocarpon pusillum]|uniref:Uncharacterized protein n=1 Tax=Endocarpon pusillum TaxID=364733 RepID=A0A8H7AEG3_9EURO|nr:hypothetical protein GJ744_003345 [Endocarpon pusillum]
MSLRISDVALPSSNLWVEDQHHLSHELAGSENSRKGQTREQVMQEIGDAESDNMEFQEPIEADLISEEPAANPD